MAGCRYAQFFTGCNCARWSVVRPACLVLTRRSYGSLEAARCVEVELGSAVSVAWSAEQGTEYGAGSDARRLAVVSCFHPLQAYRTADGRVVFSELSRNDNVQSLQLPCGQCVGCRLERSRQWAVRCMHEASLYSDNCFVSLTYDDQHLPVGRSLFYPDFQLFMRRLRARFSDCVVRFYMCGEYGDELYRPHFHACLFNVDFPDKVYFKKSESGSKLYRSAVLESLWTKGFSSVGALTFESAAYVARYVMKKITGDRAVEHYGEVDKVTGEVVERVPEFNRMSLKPGIGADWLRLYWKEVAAAGKVVVRGVECNAPRFYMKRLSKLDCFGNIELERSVSARSRFLDNTADRLAVREVVTEARVRHLKRKLK